MWPSTERAGMAARLQHPDITRNHHFNFHSLASLSSEIFLQKYLNTYYMIFCQFIHDCMPFYDHAHQRILKFYWF